MPIVDLHIGRRSYQIACEPGEEHHLLKLSQSINRRIQELGHMKDMDESMILVLTALTMQDEINDLEAGAPAPSPQPQADMVLRAEAEAYIRDILSDVTEKIRRITVRAGSYTHLT